MSDACLISILMLYIDADLRWQEAKAAEQFDIGLLAERNGLWAIIRAEISARLPLYLPK